MAILNYSPGCGIQYSPSQVAVVETKQSRLNEGQYW
jgi:hypothetical protein